MAVDDLDILCAIIPSKTQPPLFIDTDAVLTDPAASKCFQSIAGRDLQVMNSYRRMLL